MTGPPNLSGRAGSGIPVDLLRQPRVIPRVNRIHRAVGVRVLVHVLRRHKLRQALSKARAHQTGLWKVQEGKTVQREPQFDAELIEQCLKESEEQERLWGQFFERIGIDPLRVEYENLCEDYEANIRRVLNFLQISLPRRTFIGPPVTVRQADEISRTWEERFLAERSASRSLVRT